MSPPPPLWIHACWWYSLLKSHLVCDSNEFPNYGHVSVDIFKKKKIMVYIVSCAATCTYWDNFARFCSLSNLCKFTQRTPDRPDLDSVGLL